MDEAQVRQDEAERVFRFLETLLRVDKEELAGAKKAYRYYVFPEEMKITQGMLTWAKGVVALRDPTDEEAARYAPALANWEK